MRLFQNGDRVHLVDKKSRQYAFTLKAGETFQLSGDKIAHDDLIGQADGSLITLTRGKRMLAIIPTLGEYILKMPRGAQVLYPKDLALIPMWADVYPGARVFEAGTGSGALTLALLRAVGDRGHVVSYDMREDFSRTAAKNIERYMGIVPGLTLRRQDAAEGIEPDEPPGQFDRVVLDLPEPWRVVPHAVRALRSGGIYLSFVPTVPQVMQTVEALERANCFGPIENFETLLRTWNIQGRSVRPDHRMIAHSGFLTVARKVEMGLWGTGLPTREESGESEEHADAGPDRSESAEQSQPGSDTP
jgi:tRNA (adenine57-N1/adenine58-N1)-methyltransferase